MLNELHIENIAVIERADISFTGGLNVLTGETGAGKSIVIDSIGAVLGERVSRELVRPLPRWVMRLLNGVINLLRSVPFLILMIIVIPLSRLIVGTSIGTVASIRTLPSLSSALINPAFLPFTPFSYT